MAVSKERDEGQTRQALTRWLAARTGSSHVEIGGLEIPALSGFSNETLLLDAEWEVAGEVVQRGLALRVEPSGHQVFPSTELDAQVRVLRALRDDGSVPVPEVLWFEEDTSTLGDRFVAMARVDGQVPPDNPSYHVEGWFTDLPESRRSAAWLAGIDAMSAVHRVDRRRAGLTWIPSREPAEQLALDRSYRTFAAGDAPYPLLDRAFDVLASDIPPACTRPALCWGDSRMGNLIFAPDGTVAAVLDWEMVTAGDPVQDLAWYLLIDRHHHEGFGVARLGGLPSREESVARWEAESGRSAEHLAWYELLGAARYAAVVTRVLLLLESSGTFPGAAAMAYDHTASQLLGRLLDERA